MNLPTGEISLLFTDIEGSTRHWDNNPDAMRSALVRHDALLRKAIEGHEGAVFKTVGDAFCAAFASSGCALDAALAGQRALAEEDWGEMGAVRVRMALHAGPVELRDGDYFGPTVNRVARLLSAGHGGQVLVSDAARSVLSPMLPSAVELRDLGSHRLKDLQRPEHVWQVCSPSLPSDFPPLRSLQAFAHNLPVQATSFVGREREVEEVKRLLATTRLLTLTGPGGCGKTRLALQAAGDLVDTLSGGVWLVELASAADPEYVPFLVAQALGLRDEPSKTVTQSVKEHLAGRELLLMLDNCEHLVEACADLTSSLLRACPRLRILATSRENLAVAGETSFLVPPLSLPDAGEPASLDSLEKSESVRLFRERALLARPSFTLTTETASSLAQVCRRLDGIPLAIELAAAHVGVLSLEQIAARLDDRFLLLAGGNRGALPRHQTLRALIDWSYDLLKESERTLLRRLAVFIGGWTMETAEQVCSGGEIGELEVLDLLAGLVDKSLALFDSESVDGRYRLMETIRQYARERLDETEDAGPTQDRHRDWCLRLAEDACGKLYGPEQAEWLNRLDAEHANLRAALERSLSSDGDSGPRLCRALGRYWQIRGHLTDGKQWCEAFLRRAAGRRQDRERSLLLSTLGILEWSRADYVAAQAQFEEALEIERALGDRPKTAEALGRLAVVIYAAGEDEKAEACCEEALALNQEIGCREGAASCLITLASITHNRGDYARSRAISEEALALWRAMGNRHAMAVVLNNIGNAARMQGDLVSAEGHVREGLIIRRELKDGAGTAWSLEALAKLACARTDMARAARLLGAAEALREEISAPLPSVDREEWKQTIEQLQSALDAETLDSSWQEGRRMGRDGAMEYALGERTSAESAAAA